MIILSFDSTAKAASVALAKDDKLLAEYTVDNGFTQSELLLPMAESLLKSAGLGFDEVDIFTSATGPGSFTGVRIGAATVKGLAFGKNKPCISVSTLDALAENLRGLKGVIVPVMDARRNQVYTATFTSDTERLLRTTEDRAISIDALGEELVNLGADVIYLVGDGEQVARKRLLEKYPALNIGITPQLLLRQSAYSVAAVAYRKYKCGDIESDKEHLPTYLRMPQAERERLERLGKNQ